MITYRRFFITALLLVFGPVSLFVADRTNRGTEIDIEFPEAQPTVGSLQGLEDHEVSRKEMNAQRADYFFRLLRDPDINAIPENIRSRELNHARRQPTRIQHPLRIKQKDGTLATAEYTWASAGPTDVGGRTRALGIDSRDPDIILAGGVSGGMWKSVDGGRSWDLKTDPSQNQSVTSLAQDPTDPDTWYYTSGELRGQSAADRGNRSFYWGDGVYKSTDNGDSWRLLPNASSDEDFRVDKFNTISRIVISPATGSIFIASNGFGIYRSTDDGGSFPSPPLLGARGEQYWADIDVARDGRLIATLSERTFGSGGTSYTPGVFASYDDGDSWINVTPATFPDNHERSVVAFAPSAPDTAYVLTYVSGTGADEDIRFHMIDLNNLQNGGTVQSDDRSLNLPDFGESVGYMSTQQNYNMVVAVKPDDPEFVLVGGINLFRSEDGFATAPRDTDNDGVDNDSEKDAFWVGGYAKPNNVSQYPGQHADQHVVVFQPGNTGVAWTGHDGGLSRTDDITAPAVEWDNMDRGYITTQFYSADIPDNPSDQRLLGGTQDNGSPFFSYNSQTNSADGASDLSSGDGGYAYFTNSYLYVSRQNGDIIQYLTGAEGELTSPPYFAFVHPKEAEDQFFVHPYAVDPTDENIMYYPDQRRLWRNTSLSSIDRNNDPDGITQGWESFNAVIGAAYAITALEVTTRPSDILYYGASAEQMPPKIYRLENASSSTSPAEVSIPGAPDGAYVHDFAINPAGGDELMVIFSNYGIPSIYYTQDGGQTWTDVEGNLAGDGTSSDAGPSIRSGLIIPAENGTIYMVGTSTGIYTTSRLDGTGTQWVQEAPNSLGHAVTEYLAANVRGDIAAGTHGRGIYKGLLDGVVTGVPQLTAEPASGAPESTIALRAENFSFAGTADDNRVTFNGLPAEIASATPQELQVVVPRGVIPPGRNSSIVELKVSVDGITANTSFEILPPREFKLHPNFPNPFNPTTNIAFDLPRESGVIVQVYDMSGRKVLEPVRKVLQANSYNLPVDMSGLASGVYFYRVLAIPPDGNGEIDNRSGKMTLIK